MRFCILHVGMHKTGTSSIQESLASFVSEKVVYHHDGKSHGRAVFGLLGTTGGDRWWGKGLARERAPDPAARERFEDTLRSLGERTLIVSGEALIFLSREELKRLRIFFADRGIAHITISGYVRPPAAYVTSLAQQKAKLGVAHFMKQVSDSSVIDLAGEYCNYRRSFSKFDDVFGRENVRLSKFDPGSFPANCVVQHFCRQFAIDLPVASIRRVNEALSRELTNLFYTYHKFEPSAASIRGPEVQRIAERLKDISRTKFRFAPDILRRVLTANREDIDWMETRLGESLHEDLGESLPGDICRETDLLDTSYETVQALLHVLGANAPQGIAGRSSKEIAALMHALRGLEAASKSSTRGAMRATDAANRLRRRVQLRMRRKPRSTRVVDRI